ncbi:MAG: hypothetical protein M0Z95_10725, partial [Actinomycetota bacterium]|nr:hypothetical protein [Actinomycetota bacterium]
NDQPCSRRGDLQRPRTRIEQRLLALSVATVLVLVIPELRAAVVEPAIGVVTLVVVLSLVGVLALALGWRVVRRHPVADLVVGTWLLRRHERRRQQIVDARSWPETRQPYGARTWETGTRRQGW